MGIPEGDAVDCGVGTIVWVRRRNGSWWPGRILRQNELSATHLMSPRSGTPVKLLGREDASVDWYNLEKSKRVKAFRCGEFDDCIRKAELSQGYPPKKREKYARREDAILHALELEKLQIEEKQQKFGGGSNSVSDKRLSIMKRDLEYSFPSSSKSREDDARGNTRYMNIKSQPLSRKVGSPLNEEYISTPLATQKAKQASQLIWEDDNSEIVPRMRGLQDFGLKTASSKKKKSFALCEGNKRTLSSGNFIHVVSPSFRGAGTTNQISSRRSPFSMKRKLLNGGSSEESLVKRRDKRRTLVQVLQSSPKLPLGRSSQSNDAGVAISRPGGTMQMDVLGKSTGESIPPCDDMDSSGYHGKMQASRMQFGMDNSLLYSSSLTDRMTDEGESDSSEADSSSHDTAEEAAINSDASEELPLIKSKNSDRFGRYSSSVSRANGKPAKMVGEDIEDSGYSRYASRLHHSDYPSCNGIDSVSKWQLKGKRNMRNLSKRHVDVPDGCVDEEYEAEEGVKSRPWLSREACGGYWEESDDCYDPRFYTSELDPVYDDFYLQDGMYGSMLLDVDLKVQASYQGEHVPLVSLMSRLNGKAIIGHPVQVEIMEDGSSDLLLVDSSLNDDSSERNEGIPVPHVWRTARRTAMHRIPRSQRSALDNEESLPKNLCLDPRPSLKKINVGNANQRIEPKKNLNHARRVPMNKLSNKLLKKACLSNQKTRMLSSFATEQKTGSNNGKQEETTPLVTCIPVKTVFDRLRESFRLPSAPAPTKKDLEVQGDDHKDLAES